MNDDLKLLFNMKEGSEINSAESNKINEALSVTGFDDIPVDQLEDVEKYLSFAFHANAIEPHLEKPLETLLDSLRKRLNG